MKYKTIITAAIIACGVLLRNTRASIPKNAKPIKDFDLNRYLGVWYEVARLDFRFEKNLDNTSAQYTLDKHGNVIVLNSGYNFVKKKWTKAVGLAKFRGDKTLAALKVSFFRPFYSGYNVVALDEEYHYALIAGRNLDYLWILSRTKFIPDEVKNRYLKIATEIGYDTSKLIWIKHDKINNPFLNEN